MLQIIVVYFAPYYMFRMKMGPSYRFPAVIIAFVINYAAYFAEIFRSGILSIPKGQKEAAFTLGFSKTQTFFRILLPQKQASYQFSILPLCVAGLMYLVLCTIITYAFNKAEKKYSYYNIT